MKREFNSALSETRAVVGKGDDMVVGQKVPRSERQRKEKAPDLTKFMSAKGPGCLLNMSSKKIQTEFAANPKNDLGRVVPEEG